MNLPGESAYEIQDFTQNRTLVVVALKELSSHCYFFRHFQYYWLAFLKRLESSHFQQLLASYETIFYSSVPSIPPLNDYHFKNSFS